MHDIARPGEKRLRAALADIVEGIDNGATLDEVHRHARRALGGGDA
jgi:hypothetical protein